MTTCPACDRLPSVLKCNAHRTESISASILRRARAAGYAGSNPLEAEAYLNLTPIVIG